jgi:large subunit ribosomal protein L4
VQVPVYNVSGEVVKNIDVSDILFAVPFNSAVVHQAMVRQRADLRQGTHDTKTRGEVSGTGKKMFAQKHTGEARGGDKRSPTRRGGGVAFGPHPRDHAKAIPKKMRRLALKCMLSSKASEGTLIVLDAFSFQAPKTKEMVKLLDALKLDSTALLVTSVPDQNMIMSARNIPGVKTLPANTLSVVDLLSYKALVMTEDAVRKTEQLWGEESPQEEK